MTKCGILLKIAGLRRRRSVLLPSRLYSGYKLCTTDLQTTGRRIISVSHSHPKLWETSSIVQSLPLLAASKTLTGCQHRISPSSSSGVFDYLRVRPFRSRQIFLCNSCINSCTFGHQVMVCNIGQSKCQCISTFLIHFGTGRLPSPSQSQDTLSTIMDVLGTMRASSRIAYRPEIYKAVNCRYVS